ncbi:MAG: sulfite exporter TauE/SafE family protein [Crocinitomicaceae bacterium]
MNTFVITGIILGLTSSLHCMGMCGPIAMAIPVNRKNNWTILNGVLQYNLGRIFTYAVLGFIIGSIGLTIHTFGVLQWLSIISGVLLIVYAWRKWLGKSFHAKIPSLNVNGFVSKGIGSILRSQFPFKLPLLGILNGLLPCGMVFVALMNALLAGNQTMSSVAMIGFGIGTLPSMIAVGFAAGKITGALRSKLNATVPYLLTLVGVLVILRGMNLGIPFISPKAEMAMKHQSGMQKPEPEMKMDCCHSSKKECK